MNAHIIKNSRVINSIVVNSLDDLPNLIPATEGQINDLWDGERFTTPSPVPQIISPFQAKAILDEYEMLDTIEAYMADPQTPKKTRLAWQHATEYHRGSPTILNITALMGITSEQVDQMFIDGAKIVA